MYDARMKKAEKKILALPSQKKWQSWMAKNHGKSKGVWLRFFKKHSGKPTITYQEALDVALCYGWIDGQVQKYDDISWIHSFTPRRTKSTWSKRNTDHVKRLIKEKKMKPAGMKEVNAAKADGRWKKAYASPSKMTVPADFMKKLNANKKAKAFFATLNKANVYAITWRLATAKKPETREKRMKMIVEMLNRGEKFH
jgi:uncharacterized protein YdeI (YjbR/CyaY-like superfamily)